MIYGNAVGGVGLERTYILVDENGNEAVGVLVDTETELDATANDIRLGKKAATVEGVTVGEKDIPPYHTSEGVQLVTAGEEIVITKLYSSDRYDFTKMQAIICPYNTSMANSVAAEKVVINENVYAVQSVEALAAVTKNNETKTISFGITNTGTTPCVIRYFTIKEEY